MADGPPPPPLPADQLRSVETLLRGRRFAVLTGAGCSTESGIPDYRGPETARRARNPIRFQDFVGSEEGRRRYWARSFIGWPKMRSAQPNDAHRVLARFEQKGLLTGLITQNVDGLHQVAGSMKVVELHGSLAQVRCLSCGVLRPRQELQEQLAASNPGWERHTAAPAPDGDADLENTGGFQVIACQGCGGNLKPHVVFFGEGVPRERVDRAKGFVDSAQALLVVGSSLAVFSGYRFVRQATQRGIPVAMINLGPTRADAEVDARISASAGLTLSALESRLPELDQPASSGSFT